jgi:hypothetical protein
VVLEMMIVITMLIHIVSLEFQLPARMIIHNQCSDIKLISPIYFGSGVVCPKLPNQQMGIGTKMSACFEINATQDEFECALLYELQRYSGWPHKGTVTTKGATKPARIQMLIIWKMKSFTPFAYVMLLKNIKGFKWNEEKLKKFYDKNFDRLEGYDETVSYRWSIDNKTVLKTVFGVGNSKSIPELNIVIFEEEKCDYAIRPLCVNEKG